MTFFSCSCHSSSNCVFTLPGAIPLGKLQVPFASESPPDDWEDSTLLAIWCSILFTSRCPACAIPRPHSTWVAFPSRWWKQLRHTAVTTSLLSPPTCLFCQSKAAILFCSSLRWAFVSSRRTLWAGDELLRHCLYRAICTGQYRSSPAIESRSAENCTGLSIGGIAYPRRHWIVPPHIHVLASRPLSRMSLASWATGFRIES